MKKIIKRIGISILALLGLLLVVAGSMGLMGQRDLNKTRAIQSQQVNIPTDSASIAAGQRWATVLCTGCHVENNAGSKFMDAPARGKV